VATFPTFQIHRKLWFASLVFRLAVNLPNLFARFVLLSFGQVVQCNNLASNRRRERKGRQEWTENYTHSRLSFE